MINPSIEDRINSSYANIGAIVCMTPKIDLYSYVDEDGNEVLVDHRCSLVNSVEALVNYYGDPFVDPTKYSDLILAYHLVQHGNYVYISAIDGDMLEHNDDFRTAYNGYTEFSFVNNSGFDTIGYKLKSSIKFCQPIIRFKYAINRLDLYVDLYMLNRSMIQSASALRTLSKASLYKTLHYVFDTSKATDELIVSTLLDDGLELQLINTDPTKSTSFIDELKSQKQLVIYYNSYDTYKESHNLPYDQDRVERNTNSEHYWYNIHSDMYVYDFDEEEKVIQKYIDAIEVLSDKKPEPHHLLLSRLYKSVTVRNSDGLIVRSVLDDLSYDSYIYVQSSLLSLFPNECYTYCYINTPDMSSSSVVDFLGGKLYESLPENYNCDLYYGAISDYVVDSSIAHNPYRIHFALAAFAFYNIVHNSKVYAANPLDGMNISNNNIKFVVNEQTASALQDLRCNSLVSFDSNKPTIYGNRTLSLLPNLRYSHIGRNFVRLRRLIHEYLGTRKFVLNTHYNIQNCLSFIRTHILDPYVESGILSIYNIDYTTEYQTVTINVRLVFTRALESINLDFTI